MAPGPGQGLTDRRYLAAGRPGPPQRRRAQRPPIKQSTLLVRTGEPVHGPAWTVTPVSMEELVLAYMNPANDIPARRPQLGVAS